MWEESTGIVVVKKILLYFARPKIEPALAWTGLKWQYILAALECADSVDELRQAVDDPPAFLEGCLLQLGPKIVVPAVRGMAFKLLRQKGVKQSILAKLEDYDAEARASSDIAAAKAIVPKLLTGEFDGELVEMLRELLGLTVSTRTRAGGAAWRRSAAVRAN